MSWQRQFARVTVRAYRHAGQQLREPGPARRRRAADQAGGDDIFPGWTRDHGDGRHCYVRRPKGGRLAMLGEQIADGVLKDYAAPCGRTLARAHSRSGDAALIAGYLGGSASFHTVIAEFAVEYAKQTVCDHHALLGAIANERTKAHTP